MHRSLFVILFVGISIVAVSGQDNTAGAEIDEVDRVGETERVDETQTTGGVDAIDDLDSPDEGDALNSILSALPENGQGRYDALQEAAVEAQENGEVDTALRLYELLQELAPDSGEIMYNRGTLYLSRGEYDRAITLFSRAVDSGFEDHRVLYNRGNGFFAVGEYEGALRDYEAAAKLAPGDAENLNNLGLTEVQLEMYGLAESHFLQAAEIDETYADPLFHLSGVYERQGDIDSAIDALSAAIERNDLFVAAYYNRGALYYQVEEYRTAVDDYLSALRLHPNDPDILYNLGVSALAAATGERPAIQTARRDADRGNGGEVSR